MKKFSYIWVLACVLIFSWCTTQNPKLWEDEINYNGTLIVAWVWPEISMEPTVEEWTLVLRWSFEDHSDHILLDKWTWEKFFESGNEYLPWNKVKFQWIVEFIDWAAGNHYYSVKNIDTLKLIDHPNENEIKNLIDSYNYCENDDDCEFMAWECPFGCRIMVNINFKNIIWDIINNYFENAQWPKCVYDCPKIEWVSCINYKCTNTEININNGNNEISCTEGTIGECEIK